MSMRVRSRMAMTRWEATSAAYMDQLDIAFDYTERRSRELFGREPALVLEALRDPVYSLKDGYAGPSGISWLHCWAIGMGRPDDVKNEPDPSKFILKLMKRSGE
jgi:hypothetical protein